MSARSIGVRGHRLASRVSELAQHLEADGLFQPHLGLNAAGPGTTRPAQHITNVNEELEPKGWNPALRDAEVDVE